MPAQLKREKPKNFWGTMKRLIGYFKGSYPVLILVVFLVIIASLCSTAGVYMSGTVVINALDDALASGLSYDEGFAILLQDCLLLGGVYLVEVIANISYAQIMVRLSQKTLYKLRTALFAKMQDLPISYFDKHTHGEIMTYFTNDIDSIVHALNDSFTNIVLSFCNIVGTITGIFLINVYLSLIVLVFLALVCFFMYYNSKKANNYFKGQQKALSSLNSVIEEDMNGARVVKAFNHEEENYNRFIEANENWRHESENAYFHTQLNIPFNVSLSYFNFSISAVLGVVFLCNGLLTAGIGGLTSYLVYVRQACQPFNIMSQQISSILTATSGAERIFAFLDTEEEKDEGKVHLLKVSDDETKDFTERFVWAYEEEGETKTIPLRGVIEFEDVHFSYVEGREVLKGISFKVEPGKKIAFVGSTGAGKTTIISLIARFYPIDSGHIYYDGIDINDIKLKSLRRAISMVTQDTHLFTGSVYDNIRYVSLKSTDEEIVEASKKSHADSFIQHLPEGYETILHDDGANLSEGQRQLLGLTRASLNQPPVFILDEATSNIDTRSEKLIHEGLSELMHSKASIVIAHRLSTIKDADEIDVIQDGVIIERGTQDELLSLKGAYYDLYTGKKELA